MIYSEFKGKKISSLGFGTMRLPTLSNGEIDRAEMRKMTELAIKSGVNYFDTAWPYHDGISEIAIGEMLSCHPRESYYLADKFPGHQISESYDPCEIFEAQLKKCGVDYFDFYLMHNVYEGSIDVYLDPRWGIMDYFIEQKRLGRIKHLGFSTHGGLDIIERFLDAYGEHMEFCQIQLNFVDYTLQNAKEKVELLNKRNIPIWVMEPLRGGKLAKLSECEEEKLRELRPDEKIPAWSFRFLQGMSGVCVVLSGMSNIDQMQENIETFENRSPLSETEREALLLIAEGMKDSVPCTACRYCTSSCPMGLDIPRLIAMFNELSFVPSVNSSMRLDGLPEDKRPSACLACGACTKMCPQGIDIPMIMSKLDRKMGEIPKWADICKEREAAAKRLKAKG